MKIDDSRKTRILNNIKIEKEKQDGGIIRRVNKKILGSIVAGALVVSGIVVLNNNDMHKLEANGGTAGVSEMVTEKLAIIGVIEEIKTYGGNNDVIVKVAGEKKGGASFSNVDVHLHASTNIFNKGEDKLLDIKNLSKGQKVEVYYDGSETNGQISGVRVEIIN